MKYLKIFYILNFLLFISCSNKSLIYTFYTGRDGLQYFVKPSQFESNNGDVVLIDFTYQDEKGKENDVVCNFTLKTKDKPIFNIDSAFFIINKTNKIQLSELKLLFREVEEKSIRYSSSIKFNQFKESIITDQLKLLIHSQNSIYILLPTKSFKKTKEKIILEILDPKENNK